MSIQVAMDDWAGKRYMAGLQLLRQAEQYAGQLQCSPWDFAVEISALHQAGLNNSDLRWLVAAGYLQHAREIIQPGNHPRRFHSTGQLSFTTKTCFILTRAAAAMLAGSAAVRCTTTPGDTTVQPMPPSPESPPDSRSDIRPHWDPDYQQLRFGGVLVKELKIPALDQARVLTAFQEENWPQHIPDPLPPHSHLPAPVRLNYTVRGLNQHQKTQLIHFQSDPAGQCVCWTLRL